VKRPNSIFFLSVFFGVAFWFVDTVLHYLYYNPSQHGYIEMLTIHAGSHQIFVGFTFLLVSIIIGLTMSGMIRNLSMTQQNLVENEKRFRALIENTNDIVLIIDENFKYKYVSPSVTRILGYTPEEFFGKVPADFIHSDDHNLMNTVLEDVSKTPDYTFLTPEYRVRSKTGEYRTMEAIIRNQLDVPEVNGYVVNSRDVSQRSETALLLRQEKELAESLAAIGQEVIQPDKSVREIATKVLGFAQKLTDSAHGFVTTIDQINGDNIVHTYSKMIEKECTIPFELQHIRFKKGADGVYPSLWGHSLNIKKSIFTNSPCDHKEAKGIPNEHVPLQSFLSVPAMIGNNLVGQIALANSSHEYTQKDVEIVERIADFYALAVQRENYEQTIREEKDMLQTYFNVAAFMFIALDINGTITMMNRRGCEILGYKENETLGKNWFDTFIPENERQKIRNVGSEIIAGNLEPFEYHENEILTKNGTKRLIAWRNSYLRDKDGKIISIMSSGEDITEKKKIEEITRIQRDLALELVSVKGIRKTFEVSLDAAIKASGLDSGSFYLLDSENRNLMLFTHKGLSPEFISQLSQYTPDTVQHKLVMSAQPVYTSYSPMEFPENDIRRIEGIRALAVIPLIYSGRVIGCMKLASHTMDEVPIYTRTVLVTIAQQVSVAAMRAITEDELVKHRDHLEELVKDRTRELEETQEELVEKERLATLGHLVAVVSHEIRNPLGTIASSIYNIKQNITDADPIVIRSLDRADRSIKRCDAIIEELLSFTSKRHQELLQINLDDWLEIMLDEIDIPDDIQLIMNLHSGISIIVDAERLRRCLINIVTNAVQAHTENLTTSNKTIEVATKVEFDRVDIMVKDNGSGIAEADIGRIFEPLYSTKSFGVGLGLTIVRQIVEEHGGNIEIESIQGEGTTVRMWLPLQYIQF
jgi:PAS domain S-box-containing protein